jgi:CspA family cold shock protein
MSSSQNQAQPPVADQAESQSPDSEEVPIRMNLKWFNGSKGFGFVVPDDESFDAFLHVTTLQNIGAHSVGEGAILMCTIYDGPKGKQVRDVTEIIHEGAQSTVPEINEEDGTMTMGGLVKWYKPEKGFGFIIPDDRMKDIFIHQSCLERLEIDELKAGQRVKVTLKMVDKGREAVGVEVIG